VAAKMSEEELAEIWDFDPERIKAIREKKYQNARWTEILDISLAWGVEFKMAVMQVDFEEIEVMKRITAERWERKRKKASKQLIVDS
jgi:DNA-binding transcriptional regulator YiaG